MVYKLIYKGGNTICLICSAKSKKFIPISFYNSDDKICPNCGALSRSRALGEYVSKNFKFGSKRRGNIKTLKKFEKDFNYKNIITDPFKKNKKTISSTFIRKKIRAGKIIEVNKLLNRNWCIEGKVIKGKKRGSKIGFPTCNMKLNDYVIPKLGVYAVKVKYGNLNKQGIANIGYRPTFKGQSLLLETNIFGINKNLYNKVISVSFKKFIRPEKKFRNFEYLKKQIKLDIKQAKK